MVRSASYYVTRDGIAGSVIGLALGAAIAVCLSKLEILPKNHAEKRAAQPGGHADPGGAIGGADLLDHQAALAFMLSTNELRRTAVGLRLENGKLFVGNVGQDGGVHALESVSEMLIPLQGVEETGGFVVGVLHVVRVKGTSFKFQGSSFKPETPPPGN